MTEIASNIDPELGSEVQFLLELDQLKSVVRRTKLVDQSRFENTAEHSWHLAMMALVLARHAGDEVDVMGAVQMVLVHDIVEIDAGDVFVYDEAARAGKAEREAAAADRLFALLPEPAAANMRALWQAYEDHDTATGRFAYALDRLQPLLLNGAGGGGSWRANGIAEAKVRAVNKSVAGASDTLMAFATAIMDEAASNDCFPGED